MSRVNVSVNFLICKIRRVISHPAPSGFVINFIKCAGRVQDVTHTKKAWHFFAFIGTFEVFDYLILPNYNE